MSVVLAIDHREDRSLTAVRNSPNNCEDVELNGRIGKKQQQDECALAEERPEHRTFRAYAVSEYWGDEPRKDADYSDCGKNPSGNRKRNSSVNRQRHNPDQNDSMPDTTQEMNIDQVPEPVCAINGTLKPL